MDPDIEDVLRCLNVSFFHDVHFHKEIFDVFNSV